MNAAEIFQIKVLISQISNLSLKKSSHLPIPTQDYTTKIEKLSQKRDEYMTVIEELKCFDQEPKSYENLPELYEELSKRLDEYEENCSLLKTLQLLPADLDLAQESLSKLKQQVEVLGKRKRELLKI